MRFLRWTLPLLGCLVASTWVQADNRSTNPPRYTVNKSKTAPVIDGVVSPGEWNDAAAAAGDWVVMRTHVPDKHNLRFRMMWDDTALYVLGETDYDGFLPANQLPITNPDFTGGTYNPNLYLDPNADNEDLDTVPPGAPDGYQITWSMDEGRSLRRPTPGRPDVSLRNPLDDDGSPLNDYVSGLYLEAHVDNLFGNEGNWDRRDDQGPNLNYRDDLHPGLLIGLNASNTNLNGTGKAGGIWEVAIAWTEFNATNPDDPLYTKPENGLYHVTAPKTGDVWGFETSAITPDQNNFLPSWSEPKGGNPDRTVFGGWPHGRIVFAGTAPLPLDCNGDGAITAADLQCACAAGTRTQLLAQLGVLEGDLDGNKEVAFADFLVLSGNFGTATTQYSQGDIDCNGRVEFADFLVLSSNFGRAGLASGATAATVPEPGCALLSLIGLMGLLGRRLSLVAPRR